MYEGAIVGVGERAERRGVEEQGTRRVSGRRNVNREGYESEKGNEEGSGDERFGKESMKKEPNYVECSCLCQKYMNPKINRIAYKTLYNFSPVKNLLFFFLILHAPLSSFDTRQSALMFPPPFPSSPSPSG